MRRSTPVERLQIRRDVLRSTHASYIDPVLRRWAKWEAAGLTILLRKVNCMSYVTEVVLPAALAELSKFPKADPVVVRMLREATGTPRFVIEEEEAAAAAAGEAE